MTQTNPAARLAEYLEGFVQLYGYQTYIVVTRIAPKQSPTPAAWRVAERPAPVVGKMPPIKADARQYAARAGLARHDWLMAGVVSEARASPPVA
jgi:hypothetical protein